MKSTFGWDGARYQRPGGNVNIPGQDRALTRFEKLAPGGWQPGTFRELAPLAAR